MNARSYKTVFSKRLGTLVAVGEHATSQGKANGAGSGGGAGAGTSATLGYIAALTAGFAFVSLAWAAPANNALPTSGTVVQGAASMAQSANQLNITQSTQRAAINWQSFDIGSQARVQVVQPNAQSVLLNRVVGNTPSQIFGHMQANGHVILVNPNGVLFGKDGSVNAGGFTASTLNISDANFMAGNMVYERNGSTAGIVNQGNITAAPGGYVALLGASVSNEGSISTKGGSVVMGAGETIKVPVSGTGRIKLELTPAAINASVSNSGSIVTEGGQVYMQALALNRAAAQIIQSGSIDTTSEKGGDVHLLADGGQIRVSGSITANSMEAGNKGGDIVIGRDEVTGVLAAATDVSGAKLESRGGFIETSGHDLKIDGAQVKAANWLLDPDNIDITDGTATTGYSAISATTLSGALTSGTNITVNTTGGVSGTSTVPITGTSLSPTGKIKVSSAISKTSSGEATLNLIADDSIILDNSITSSGTGAGKLNINLTAANTISGTGNLSANGGNITLTSTNLASTGKLSGSIAAAQLTKAGAGKIIQTGALTTSAVNVNGGTWEIGDGTTNGSVAIASGSSAVAFVIGSGATLAYNVKAGTTLDTVSSTYSGTGTLQKNGDGTLQWGGAKATFALSGGFIDVQKGVFVAATNNNEDWTANKSNLNVATGATFNGVEGAINVDALTGGGTISSGWPGLAYAFNVGVNNGSGTFSGVIKDSANAPAKLNKLGTGTQILTGANTYTGATTVSAGTLVNNNMGNFKTSSIAIASGATFEANVASNTEYTAATTVSGAGTFKKTGVGGLRLTSNIGISLKFANNTGGKIDIQAGSLQNDVRQASLKYNLADVNIESGALLDMRGETVQMRGLTGAGNIINTHSWENQLTIGVGAAAGSTYSYSGVIGANVGNASLLKNTENGVITNATASQILNLAKSGAGTQILTGTNIYTGTTTISAGTLQIGDGGTSGTLGTNTGTITNNGNLTIKRSDAFGIANVISGTGSLTQAGAGTTTLTGANNYSGITTVSGGTLQVGNGGGTGALGTGNVNMANGSNLNYKRNVTTTITNTISGTGNVNADITAGGLIVARGINLTTGDIKLVGSNAEAAGVGVRINDVTLQATSIEVTGTATGTNVDLAKAVQSSGTLNATNNITLKGSSTNTTGVGLEGGSVTAGGAVDIDATTTTGRWQGANIGVAVQGAGVKIKGNSNQERGVAVGANVIATNGAVVIEGTSVLSHGVDISSGKTVAATGGDVKITGASAGASALRLDGAINAYQDVILKGTNTGESNATAAVYSSNTVTATNGKINVTASSSGSTSNAVQLDVGANLGAKTEVNIKTDTLSIATTGLTPATISAGTSGSVTIKTDSTAAKIDLGAGDVGSTTTSARSLGLTNAELNRITAGNLVIGDASNTGGITVSAATTTNATSGNLTLQTGGNIALNAALTVGDLTMKKLALHAGGSLTQAASNAAIKAAELQLKGLTTSATFKLSEKTNSVGKLAAAAKSVEYANAGALEIGEVDVLGLTTPVSSAVSGITTTDGASITTQTGNLTIAKAVTNSTSGDVVLGAGVSYDAGHGADGDVQTARDVTVTNNNPNGGIYIFTGSASTTGFLSHLDESFSELRLSDDMSGAQNADSNVKYAAGTTIERGAKAQVMFREKITLNTSAIRGATLDKIYGDANTKNTDQAALFGEMQAQLKQANPGQIITRSLDVTNGTNGAGEFKISKAALIDDLSGSISSPAFSASQHLTAKTHEYSALTSTKYAATLAAGEAKVVVAKKELTGSIALGNSTYGDALAPGNVTWNGAVGSDDVKPSLVAINTTGNTSQGGHLNAGTYSGIQTVTATGTDKDNYSFTNVKGDYKVDQRQLTIAPGSVATKTADGTNTATVTPGALSNLVGTETLGVAATGTFSDANAGNNKAVNAFYTLQNGANGGAASNYILALGKPGNPDTRMTGNILASVNPVINPTPLPVNNNTGSRVSAVSGFGGSGAATGVLDDKPVTESREVCSDVFPENCECQPSVIPSIEICFAPKRVAATKEEK